MNVNIFIEHESIISKIMLKICETKVIHAQAPNSLKKCTDHPLIYLLLETVTILSYKYRNSEPEYPKWPHMMTCRVNIFIR